MPAYTTIERVKLELGLDLAASTDDVFLNHHIQSSTRLFETLTGRRFDLNTYTHRVEQPLGFRRLQLPASPIVAITTLSYKGNLLDPADYLIEDAEAGFVVRTDGQSWQPTTAASNNVSGLPSQQPIGDYVVSYQAGYATVPEDVQNAVLQQVVLQWHKKGYNPNVKSISVLGDSMSFASGIESQYHPAFQSAVSRWTKVPVL